MADPCVHAESGPAPARQVLVMERRAVARHYLRGWFALDVVASFPLDLIFAGKRMDMWRLPRLLKIIRVMNYKSLTHAGPPRAPAAGSALPARAAQGQAPGTGLSPGSAALGAH